MSAVHSKAYKDRGKAEGRCRDCSRAATFASYCDRCTKRRRESSRKYQAKKRAERPARRAFIPSRFTPQRVPTAMDFITKPFAKTIPDGNVALLAACPWLSAE